MSLLFPKAIEDNDVVEEVLSSEDEQDEGTKARKRRSRGALASGFNTNFQFVDSIEEEVVDHYDGIKPFLKKTVASSLQEKIDRERQNLQLKDKVVLGEAEDQETVIVDAGDDLVQEMSETSGTVFIEVHI